MGVLAAIPLAPGAEVTVECNPDTVTAELVSSLPGRRREPGEHRRAVDGATTCWPRSGARTIRTTSVAPSRSCASGGFDSFNLDLIYGAVGETLDDWRRTLDGALALDPPHVSAYGLTVEAGHAAGRRSQPLSRRRQPGRRVRVGRRASGRRRASRTTRSPTGPIPGHECRHNLLYWSQGDYLGFGGAAHSHRAGRRWWNVRTPERYIALVEEGGRRRRRANSSTPRRGGWKDSNSRCGRAPGVPRGTLDEELLDGLVERRDQRLVLTRSGRLLANEIAIRLQ